MANTFQLSNIDKQTSKIKSIKINQNQKMFYQVRHDTNTNCLLFLTHTMTVIMCNEVVNFLQYIYET